MEFPTEALRDTVLGIMSNGIDDAIMEQLSFHDLEVEFDFKKSSKHWGWDGKGDPTIMISEYADDEPDDVDLGSAPESDLRAPSSVQIDTD